MLFNSLNFFFFFILVFFLYWIIPKQKRWIVLLASSYYFYSFWNLGSVFLLGSVTLLNFIGAIQLEKSKHRKKILLFYLVASNLALLFVFKYFNFFTHNLNQLFQLTPTKFNLPTLNLILPIGISFYIFQSLGYLIDVYNQKISSEKNLGQFAFFLSFFPKIIAGPIEKSSHLLPQLKITQEFSYKNTVSGLQLFTLGLFKKMVIADNLALIVNQVFDNLTIYKGFSLVFVLILYSWQIYSDFSGYTDMARGLARVFNINLIKNFNHPYLSTSVRDFWRRWHISLSTWLKDYLYIPLGGSRHGIIKTITNTLIVFILCGLWHGSSWNFVIWGTLHGVMISFERLKDYFFKKRFKIPNFISIIFTYSFITFSWIFFRSETINDSLYILRNFSLGLKNFLSISYISASLTQIFKSNSLEMIITLSLLFIFIIYEYLSAKFNLVKIFKQQPVFIRYSIYIITIMAITHLRDANIAKFIYTQF